MPKGIKGFQKGHPLLGGGFSGYNHSKESKKKISDAHNGKTPWNKGTVMSFEHRQKLSNVHKGLIQEGQFQKGHIPWIKNKHHTEATKKKIGLGNNGHFHDTSTRLKISAARKGKGLGRIVSEETRNKMSVARQGMKLSEQHKENLSKAHKGKFGLLSSNWQGGLSFLPYSDDWTETLRESIRQRDDYICQLCSKTQKQNKRKLSVHHIDYNKENCNSKNLVSLCISCNSKVNAGRKLWTKVFKQKLKLKLCG